MGVPVVFFTRNLSANGIEKIKERISKENGDMEFVVTCFQGHDKVGFKGANINTYESLSNKGEGISAEDSIEKITGMVKSVIESRNGKIAFINTMENPGVGVLGSTDILAIDSACVDLTYAIKKSENLDTVKSIEANDGIRQLEYMRELGMGSDEYVLIDTDNGDNMLFPEEAVVDIVIN